MSLSETFTGFLVAPVHDLPGCGRTTALLLSAAPPVKHLPMYVRQQQTWHLHTSGETAAIDVSFSVAGMDGYLFVFCSSSSSNKIPLLLKCNVSFALLFSTELIKWNHMSDAYHRTGDSTNMSVTQSWADGERELVSRLFSISWWNVQHGSCSVVFSFLLWIQWSKLVSLLKGFTV